MTISVTLVILLDLPKLNIKKKSLVCPDEVVITKFTLLSHILYTVVKYRLNVHVNKKKGYSVPTVDVVTSYPTSESYPTPNILYRVVKSRLACACFNVLTIIQLFLLAFFLSQ